MAFSCLVNESPKIHFKITLASKELEVVVHNAAALHVQKSLALNPVRGNCSRKRQLFQDPPQIDNTPLPKRMRSKK